MDADPLMTARDPIAAALADLERDRRKVFGPAVVDGCWSGAVETGVDTALAPDTFVLETDGDTVRVRGGDDLGVVYGLYEFSHRRLGVDPLWFWRDLPPEPRTPAPFPRERIESGAPAFRFRGYFLNDEDLLAHWGESSGCRFTELPNREEILARPNVEQDYERRLLDYYSVLPDLQVMDRVFESILRLRGNLIIVTSFIDIMAPDEARLVEAALRRGLYVSSHHVEPLGVSHYAFETWCARQGQAASFSYRASPDAMRAAWRAYAQRWYEVAGDRLVWQVGLRGRGDRPLWEHDPEAKSSAAQLIETALREQVGIIRDIDKRDAPPVTWTLWWEGAALIREGRIRVPPGVTIVFTDHPRTLNMQEDFHSVPREPGRGYGVYAHAAVWSCGPHLVQGISPARMSRMVRDVFAKGDREYAILNFANVREHVLQVAVWAGLLWDPRAFDPEAFLDAWAPGEWPDLLREFFSCLAPIHGDWLLFDGETRRSIHYLIERMERGASSVDLCEHDYLEGRGLEGPIATLEAFLSRADTAPAPERWRPFLDANVRAQARILLGLYRTLAALGVDPPGIPDALRELRETLSAFELASRPPWQDWYRGDKKVGVRDLIHRLERLL